MDSIWQTAEYRELIGRLCASTSNYEPVANAIQLDGSATDETLVFRGGYQHPALTFGGLPFNYVFDTLYNTKTHFKYVTTIGATTYTLDDSAIQQLSYTEKSISGNQFSFGDFVGRLADFTLYDTDGTYDAVSFEGASGHLYFGVEKVDTSIFWIDYGTFVVDDCKRTAATIWFALKDKRYLFNSTMATISSNKTLYQMAQEVCSQAGVTLGTTSGELPNASIAITNTTALQNKTLSQLVSAIAQATGTYAIIGKDDKLYFKWYSEVLPVCSIPANLVNASTTVADYVVNVTGATWIDIDGVSHTIGTTGYVAKVEGNPFQFANYDLFLQELSYRILGTTYTPITLKYIGNPALEVGDIVVASDGRGNAYSLPITSIYINNLMSQKIRSVGESHVTTTNTNVSTSVAIEKAKQEAISFAKYSEVEADRIKVGGSGIPGVLSVKSASDVEVIRLDTTGITMADGTSIIGGNGVKSTFVFSTRSWETLGCDINTDASESNPVGISLDYYIPANFVVDSAILYIRIHPQYGDSLPLFLSGTYTGWGYPRGIKIWHSSTALKTLKFVWVYTPETINDHDTSTATDITTTALGVSTFTPSVPTGVPNASTNYATEYTTTDIKSSLSSSGHGKISLYPTILADGASDDYYVEEFKYSGNAVMHLVVIGYKK